MTMEVAPLFETFGVAVTAPGTRLVDLRLDDVVRVFTETGLILFRGFDTSVEDFERFGDLLSGDFMVYTGGGYVRRTVDTASGTIQSVNYYLRGDDWQSTFELPVHGEMYYLSQRPLVMFFYCVTPAQQDGETSFCDGTEVYRGLRESTRDLFRRQRLKYIRTYEPGEWEIRFDATGPDDVARFCAENGLSCTFDERGALRTEYLHPATIKSRWGAHDVFTNNILTVVWQEETGKRNTFVRLEDGSPIPDDVIQEIKDVTFRLRRLHPWRPKEVAIVDNTRVLHGRMSFDDQRRQLLSRMCRSVPW
jgi:alpha-ketoglutarate-dependent taurine dioxygenase